MLSHRRTTRAECLAYLGARFRIMLDVPERMSDVEAGEVAAKFENGILQLTVPKKEAKQVEGHKYIAIE